MIKTDFHIHTIYSDGKNTPEELIAAAIENGFSAIGFSDHSYTPFELTYCIKPEKQQEYFNEITRLKKVYRGKIEIFCGLEQDLFSPAPLFTPDYLIGSAHYIKINDKFYPIDESAEDNQKLIEKYFGGDFEAFSEYYFDELSALFEKQKPQIVGHFDLITLFDKKYPLKKGERYYQAAKKAIDKLLKTGAVFEVNTGAIARGYRDIPYPEEELLKYIKKCSGKVILSSDCHDKKNLGFGFDNALKLIQDCGFNNEDIRHYPK